MASHTRKVPKQFASGLALCAGSAGLELGLHLALNEKYRTVGYVEREAYAAATLVKRMEEKGLDQAPIWDDITTFKSRPWRGCVDIVSSGFPCQPFSVSGRREGTKDERWLWPYVENTLREVQPSFFFMENVPALINHKSGAFGKILGSLAELGFNAEWTVLGAKDIGIPQTRKRLFLLAYPDAPRLQRFWSQFFYEKQYEFARVRRTLAHTNSIGKRETNKIRTRGNASFFTSTFPPNPFKETEWKELLAYNPTVKPSVRRDAYGTSYRVDRLRVTGNAVIPVVAATAFRLLGERAGIFQGGQV